MDVLTSPDELALIETSEFYIQAVSSGMFLPQTTAVTVFLPLEFTALSAGETFEEFWNRHVVTTTLSCQGHGVREVTSLSGLVYTLDEDSIGGCPLSNILSNVPKQGCMFHGVDASHLPEIRPTVDSISRMGRVFLSGQHLPFAFEALGLEPTDRFTLFATFNDDKRKQVGEKSRVHWTGANTVCRVKTPILTETADLMLWFRLYDNLKGYPVATRLWSWYIRVQASPETHRDIVFHDFHPQGGKENDILWLRGENFTQDMRVFVGSHAAPVHHLSETLICCFVPPGAGAEFVKVSTADVHQTHNRVFKYQ